MDEFVRRPAGDRQAFIGEAAARRDLTPIVIEKDLWVCWTLRRLMTSPKLVGHMTFKGGTSLSKAYGIIERFSEDIDLTISRAAPLIDKVKSPMDEAISNNERKRRTDALKEAAQAYVKDVALVELAREFEAALGTAEGWQIVPDPEDAENQTLLFHYPRSSGYGLNYGNDYGGAGQKSGEEGYIKPRIKLEFGARGETEPFEERPIQPYLAEDFGDDLPDSVTLVPTLAVERTFWEKATILHALFHNGKLRPGMSRHYYDLVMLDRAGVTEAALARPDLLANVVRNKSLMFADKTASYDSAQIGTMRLSASDQTAELLAADYAAMSEMFMNAAPTLDELNAAIAALEAKINQPTAAPAAPAVPAGPAQG